MPTAEAEKQKVNAASAAGLAANEKAAREKAKWGLSESDLTMKYVVANYVRSIHGCGSDMYAYDDIQSHGMIIQFLCWRSN